MPAVVRGGRRQATASKAAPKKTASASRRKGKRPAPGGGRRGKLRASQALAIPDRAVVLAVGGVLLLGARPRPVHRRPRPGPDPGGRERLRRAAGGDGASGSSGVQPAGRLAGRRSRRSRPRCDLHRGEPILSLDLNGAAPAGGGGRLGQAGAQVVRLLPDTLVIAVDRAPAAGGLAARRAHAGDRHRRPRRSRRPIRPASPTCRWWWARAPTQAAPAHPAAGAPAAAADGAAGGPGAGRRPALGPAAQGRRR